MSQKEDKKAKAGAGKDALEDSGRAAYRNMVLQAWIDNRMEKDKTLIAVSSGGIGLLVTLLATADSMSLWVLGLYLLAMLFFVVCVIILVVVFGRNSDLLFRIYSTGKHQKDPILKRLDKWATSFFWCGIIVAFIIGAIAGYEKLPERENVIMSDDRKINEVNKPLPAAPGDLSEHSLGDFPEYPSGLGVPLDSGASGEGGAPETSPDNTDTSGTSGESSNE